MLVIPCTSDVGVMVAEYRNMGLVYELSIDCLPAREERSFLACVSTAMILSSVSGSGEIVPSGERWMPRYLSGVDCDESGEIGIGGLRVRMTDLE